LSRIARGFFRLLAVLAIAGVGAAAAGLVLQARADLRHRAQKDLLARASVLVPDIDVALSNDIAALNQTIHRRGFVTLMGRDKWPQMPGFLEGLRRSHPRLKTTAIYDERGVLRVRVPFIRSLIGRRFSQQEYFTAARRSQNVHVSKIFVGLGKEPSIVIAYSLAIRDRKGHLLGVLATTMPVTKLDQIVAPKTAADSVVRLYNQYGQLVEPSPEVKAQDVPADRTVQAALKGSPAAAESGNSVVAAVPMPRTGWVLTITEPTRVAYIGENDDVLHWSLLAGIATVLAAVATLAIGWGAHDRHHASPPPPTDT
jgi:hypothetical protein